MGPGRFSGPPPHEMNEKLKEPLPKTIKELPSFISRLTHSFFFRLSYIIKLVWEAKKSLLFIMIFLAAFNGISPVIAAYISANLLNKVALALTLPDKVPAGHAPAICLHVFHQFSQHCRPYHHPRIK